MSFFFFFCVCQIYLLHQAVNRIFTLAKFSAFGACPQHGGRRYGGALTRGPCKKFHERGLLKMCYLKFCSTAHV